MITALLLAVACGTDVLVSYSHEDEAVAVHLVKRLERDGYRVQYSSRDVQIAPLKAQIRQSIETADAMVVILSEHSLASDWVRRELRQAKQSDVPIYPVRVCSVAVVEDSGHWIRGWYSPDMRSGFRPAYRTLIRELAKLP